MGHESRLCEPCRSTIVSRATVCGVNCSNTSQPGDGSNNVPRRHSIDTLTHEVGVSLRIRIVKLSFTTEGTQSASNGGTEPNSLATSRLVAGET
jgi:hypothetical protein